MVLVDVKLLQKRELHGGVVDDLWRLYERSFDQLRVLAVQRHLLDKCEFAAALADPRVLKLIACDRGQPCGIVTLTNELEAMPLVSPDYFADRWPDLFRRNLIWYIGFLFVDPDHRCSSALSALIGGMCAQVSSTGGIIAADFCQHNERALRLPALLSRVARGFNPGMTSQRLDAQTYWAFEFPTPA